MSELPSANYLDTRLSIMAAELLPEPALRDLIEQPLDSGIGRVLGVDADTVADNPLLVEHALSRQLLADLAVVLRPLAGPAREFFGFWARRFELANLKALIRGKLRHLPNQEIERQFHETPGFTRLPMDQLLRAEDVTELLRQIEAGPYGAIARQARRALEEKHDSVALEAVIDQRYYLGLVQRARQLPPPERAALNRLLGVQLDRLNLGWLLRYRLAYGLSPTETYYYLIGHGRVLGRDLLLGLVEMSDLDSVLAALPAPLTQRLADAADIFTVEARMQAWVREQARALLRGNGPTAARALAYLLLRDSQLRRLRAVLQGKRLGLDQALIHQATGLELH